MQDSQLPRKVMETGRGFGGRGKRESTCFVIVPVQSEEECCVLFPA